MPRRRTRPQRNSRSRPMPPPTCTEAAERDRLGVLGGAGEPAVLGDAVHRRARLVGRAVREVVRRRQAQRGLQLRGPPRRGRQRRPRRDPLGRRTRRRQPHPDVLGAAGRGVEGGQRADRARPESRRPGRDLHADGARSDRRDAGLRAARGDAQRRVRRVLGGRAARPHRRRPGQAADHHRRAISPRQRGIAERSGRRGGQRPGLRGARPGGAAHRHRRADGPRVATCGGTTPSSPPRRSTQRRRSTPSIRCFCSTRPARPASPRASCTPPAAT